MLAWPLVAFGGVYRWAAVPYLAACGLLALAQARDISRTRTGDRWLDLSLAGLVAGVLTVCVFGSAAKLGGPEDVPKRKKPGVQPGSRFPSPTLTEEENSVDDTPKSIRRQDH